LGLGGGGGGVPEFMPWWQKGEDDEDNAQQKGPGDQPDVNVQERVSWLMTDFWPGQVDIWCCVVSVPQAKSTVLGEPCSGR